MRKFILATTALSVLLTTPALVSMASAAEPNYAAGLQLAQSRGEDMDWNRSRGQSRDRWDQEDFRWQRGDRLPPRYRGNDYVVSDYRRHNLRKPPRNHRWVRVDDRFVLTAVGNGMIVEIVMANDQPRRIDRRDERRDDHWRDDGYRDTSSRNWRNPPPPPPGRTRDDVWRARYSKSYNLNDDSFYRECRNKPDPAGALMGAVAGGLLGRSVAGRGDRAEGTVLGVIAGGAIGAALTTKVECEDRSYMYKTYSQGFNSGRPGSRHTWENPRNRHRGEMEVIDYYEDEDNFRCAVFSNTIYIDGRREEARGRACQQPDGNWAIID